MITTDDRIYAEKDGSFTINADWYQKQYHQVLEENAKLKEQNHRNSKYIRQKKQQLKHEIADLQFKNIRLEEECAALRKQLDEAKL